MQQSATRMLQYDLRILNRRTDGTYAAICALVL